MSLLRTFHQNRSGSLPAILGVAMLPLAGVTGLAMDYARANQVKAQLQNAADSTVLMLAREAPKKDVGQLAALGADYFAALRIVDPDIVVTKPAITKGKQNVVLEVQGTVKTFFSGLFGYPSYDIGVKAASAYGTSKLDIALVLDNTGSMASDNKIGELKKASNSLLSMLEDASNEPGQIRVAVVPYTTRVKLATSFRFESWLTNKPTGSFGKDYSSPASRTGWGGCVADRDRPHNTTDRPASVAIAETLYPMVSCAGSLAEVVPLTDDWGKLRNRIDSMTAYGSTNITLGAQWGLEMLSGAAPFSDSGTDRERFMILLTDGENTEDRWNSSNGTMNADTQSMCNTITERGVPAANKKYRIHLYTVLVVNGNDSLLRSCASKPGMFYKVDNASQLDGVFRKIADEIRQVRLSM